MKKSEIIFLELFHLNIMVPFSVKTPFIKALLTVTNGFINDEEMI